MSDVIVLMSTYNGEKYIAEQIDSIYNQDFDGSIQILIRDDGSKDHTKEIIKQYENTPRRNIQLIEENNVGPQRSFLKLIQAADEAKFYFFSDQDDFWYADKIRRAVRQIGNKEEPVCYCSNYDIYNTQLKIKNR